jgi:hypothetical protein
MKAASDPTRTHGLEVIVDSRPVLVAVKGVSSDERIDKPGWSKAVVRAVLRTDMQACARLNFPLGKELDRWIASLEPSLGVLVNEFEGYPPPFPGHRLSIQRAAPGDPWVLHMLTVGDRWRDSLWLVKKE